MAEVYTVLKKKPDGIVSYVFNSLESAIDFSSNCSMDRILLGNGFTLWNEY